ncbi:65-kDa microtubule-associated protein 3, partial [Striga asiatica]
NNNNNKKRKERKTIFFSLYLSPSKTHSLLIPILYWNSITEIESPLFQYGARDSLYNYSLKIIIIQRVRRILNFCAHVFKHFQQISVPVLIRVDSRQIIWNEIGESDADRERVLVELEQECLEVYKRKVDQANMYRGKMRQAIADAEVELAAICSTMGETPVHIRQTNPHRGNLKDELKAILPQIEEMRKRRTDRKNQFIEVLNEIQCIEKEIYRSDSLASNDTAIDESDLSIKKLEELRKELQELRKEKSERLKLVLDGLSCLCSLCIVLGLDFTKIVVEIHPSLAEAEGSKSISNGTVDRLGTVVQQLRLLKIQRMKELQDLAASLLELWNLMDTPAEEQQTFQKVTCKLVATEDEITEPDMLSVDVINHVKKEVSRLEELKASKMKEFVLKKKAELEAICRMTRLIPEKDSNMEAAIDALEYGDVDAVCLLEQIELQIARVKEDVISRKEILEKVEKWVAACDEESWLDEYNKDDNRYNAGRGAHVALKRAEKARALVSKLPAMVDALTIKVISWENEEGREFNYNGVRLLSMLEAYMLMREEKEIARKRQRDQKKIQGQLLAEQEALYGAKPSPKKIRSVKKEARFSSCGGSTKRKLSTGAPMLQTPKRDTSYTSAKATPNTLKAKTNMHVNMGHLKDDGLATSSSGRRVSNMTSLPFKHSPNTVYAREPNFRKPFNPISATSSSSKSNTKTIPKNLHMKNKEKLQKPLAYTPPRQITHNKGQENRTPKTTGVALYPTPSTASIPMQTTITPTPVLAAVKPSFTTTNTVEDEFEYSFEEKRAGFVLPRSMSSAMKC